MSELIGYASALCVRPGETIEVKVSTDASAYGAEPVRLFHGDVDPAGPGLREEPVDWGEARTYDGRVQIARPGSYGITPATAAFGALDSFTVHAWVRPTLDVAEPSGLIAWWDDERRLGFALCREEAGDLSLRISCADGSVVTCRTDVPLPRGVWSSAMATYDQESGTVRVRQDPRGGAPLQRPASGEAKGFLDAAGVSLPLRIAAFGAGTETGGFFTGRIDRPAILSRALDEVECDRVAAGEEIAAVAGNGALLAAWDFAADQSRATVDDVGEGGLQLELVNAPARAVTGFNYSGEEVDFRLRPREYAAIHFHHDDLEDAGWETDFAWKVPDDAPSGVYAAKLTAGDLDDHVPIIVRPTAEPTADVLLVLPTFTYLAYANERLVTGEGTPFAGAVEELGLELDFADAILKRHPEWGISLYDVHADGSPGMYASWRRPIPNLRPRYRFWCTGGPERLSEDLCIVDWLDHIGVACDVVTDDDVHREGRVLLERYPVVLTGSHPEYISAPEMHAFEDYLAAGGKLMYLGGNGFYWVIAVDEERPHVLELRRGVNGSQTWESDAGEFHHSTTGEVGGLWRYRGHPPNALTGVGYTGASDQPVPSAGYVRCPDSHDERVSFIFDGIGEDEVIGEFGLIRDGAAGYEIDRYDVARGTPGHALLLATSQGRHPAGVTLAVEDMLSTLTNVTGEDNPDVRADMVYVEHLNGGAVFSVGSCNWCGSLSHDRYENNVARIAGNVLERFRRVAHGA
jgi:N,N-dimethylformamidase